MPKHRVVIAIPFHTDLKRVLVRLNDKDSIAAKFICGFEQTGESSIGAICRIFYNDTGLTTIKDDWDRFHVAEDNDYIAHMYCTKRNIFAAHSMRATTELGIIRLAPIRGWWIPDALYSLSEIDVEPNIGAIAPDAEMQYIIPMARAAAITRWSINDL